MQSSTDSEDIAKEVKPEDGAAVTLESREQEELKEADAIVTATSAALALDAAASAAKEGAATASETDADEAAAPGAPLAPESSRLIGEVLSRALALEESVAAESQQERQVSQRVLTSSRERLLQGLHWEPEALVSRAIEVNGSADASSLSQAQVDSLFVSHMLDEMVGRHQRELQGREDRIRALGGRLDKHRKDVRQLVQDMKAALESQREEIARVKDAEREAAVTMARVQESEAAGQEARSRLALLGELREHVNALSRAFSLRSEERKASHTAHKLSMGTSALRAALDDGRPIQGELALLATGCGSEDVLVDSAVTALRAALAGMGRAESEALPTQSQLEARFPAVCRAARTLSFLPEGSSGMLSMGLAKAAAALKVRVPLLNMRLV